MPSHKYKPISTHPHFMHDRVIGPIIIIFPILCIEWNINNNNVKYKFQHMIKLFNKNGHIHMSCYSSK